MSAACSAAPNAPDLALRPHSLGEGTDLYLEVFINGTSRELIAAFRMAATGELTIEPGELREAGLQPVSTALDASGRIVVARLPGVTADYDEAQQVVRFTATEDARVPLVIAARPQLAEVPGGGSARWGGVVNYTIFAAGGHDRGWRFEGVSGFVEARAFGPLGIFSSTLLAHGGSDAGARVTRLETAWTWSDPSGPTTYRAGDLISGGLGWTRPVRLGGIQVRRNFALRPDLVTTPLADLRGAADVPSSVEVYVNGAQQFAAEVPAGPFEVSNLPLVTGAGTVRVVVRDALGRENIAERPFFASSQMLAPGLLDFSAELGFARRGFGGAADSYDARLMGSASVRYGLSDGLTLEGHGEGGGGLTNGGVGIIASLGSAGAGAVSASFSRYKEQIGYQLSASLELAWEDVRLFALTQRSFDDYADIASVTASSEEEGSPFLWRQAAPPRALDQLALSLPGPFENGALSFSYTRFSSHDRETSRLVAFSLSQPVWEKLQLFATAFQDLERDGSYGLFAGLSFSLGDDIQTSTSVSQTAERNVATADIVKAERAVVGDYGWRVQLADGRDSVQSAGASYRASFGRLEGTASYASGRYRATAEIDGAIALGSGGVFFTNRIDDAFAVVETGAPDVEVKLENRPVGRTDSAGRLLVPGLNAYQENHLSIDPDNLPLDASVETTARVAIPADRSGAVVSFAVNATPAALVTLRTPTGGFVEAGSSGRLDGAAETFIVGYDGEAYVTHLAAQNRLTVISPEGATCDAEFAFAARPGVQVRVPDVLCRPVGGAP